jgi:hypothetical protein
MRFFLLAAVLSLPAVCQTSPAPETQTLQTLLNEVRELRLSIDRSTLLGARTQIALQRIQIQEARTARLSQGYESIHQQAEEIAAHRARTAARAKENEDNATRLGDSRARQEAEEMAKQLKAEVDVLAGTEQRARVREAELGSQLQIEQGRLQELFSRVDEMERALDQAIRQITGKQ